MPGKLESAMIRPPQEGMSEEGASWRLPAGRRPIKETRPDESATSPESSAAFRWQLWLSAGGLLVMSDLATERLDTRRRRRWALGLLALWKLAVKRPRSWRSHAWEALVTPSLMVATN